MTAKSSLRRDMVPLEQQIERAEVTRTRRDEATARKQAKTAPPAQSSAPDLETILAFENRWPTHNGTKESAIIRELHLTAARYYQLLNCLIDTPEALKHDPMLVNRLLDARARRIQARTTRSLTRNP